VVKVRFAPSPTGSLHVGNALAAVANRRFADERGGTMLLRIDDTDPARNLAGGIDAIMAELEWLRVSWDEGPVLQSERQERYREAAQTLGHRFNGITLLREDGTATFHLASVVDDADFAISHVIRGADHRPNEALHARLHEALGSRPPEVIHYGLVLGPDGRKLSKRHGLATLSDLREAGIPASAVRAYLEELGLPRHDVNFDIARIGRLSTDAIAAMSDDELAGAVGAPRTLAPALRGARDLVEARETARAILEPEEVSLPTEAATTLERFKELRAGANGALDADAAKSILRELKAVGGDLRALRFALTGRERGPELWSILTALDREETLRRIDAAL
jgi:glutamyl-tRNA synthetase